MKIKLSVLSVLFLFISSGLFFAQQKKDLNKKLGKIKDAKKIVISTDNGDIIFDGKDAQKLLKRMKENNRKMIKFIPEDDSILTEDFFGDDSDADVMVWHSENGDKKVIKHIGKGNKMMMFMNDDDDFDLIGDKRIVKIEVEQDSSVNNGEKTVTETTIENGKKEVKTYTGKEADEFLKNMEKEYDMLIDIDEDFDGNKTSNMVWIENDGDSTNIEKNVDVKIEDGNKKVTVRTIKNGKESVKIYEGDDADKYLDKSKDTFHDKKRIKRKIIIK